MSSESITWILIQVFFHYDGELKYMALACQICSTLLTDLGAEMIDSVKIPTVPSGTELSLV